MAALGNGTWIQSAPNTLVSSVLGYDSTANGHFDAYQCYMKGDTTHGSGESPIAFPGHDETGLCQPYSGNPGAVVIVW